MCHEEADDGLNTQYKATAFIAGNRVHLDAAPPFSVDAVAGIIILTHMEEYVGGACCAPISVADNPLEFVTMWDEKSGPCSESFVPSRV